MIVSYLTYAIGGAVISLMELLLTIILTEFYNMWYIYSYIIALFTGSLVLFFYHRHITFQSHNAPKRRYPKFLLFLGSVYVINITALYLLSRIAEYLIGSFNLTHPFFHYHYVVLIIIIAIPSSLLGFYLNKKHIFVFREKKSVW